MELTQRYIDILDEIIESDIHVNTEVFVRVEGETIKFPSIEDVTQWLRP
jgi:hypothetical protein